MGKERPQVGVTGSQGRIIAIIVFVACIRRPWYYSTREQRNREAGIS